AVADGLGAAPDFIDGHQHVHHLPGVRRLLLDWLADHPVPVRSTARLAGPGFGLKRLLIAGTGGWPLGRALRRQQRPHNRLLLGAYDFVATDYRALMRGWLAQVPAEGALLFCHPGRPSPEAPPDAIAAARVRELAYLASDDWPRDLVQAGVVLAPLWAV
ncbi:MAG: cellobiose phosphorylase, partial [Burkholderiales bacterium PBB5]